MCLLGIKFNKKIANADEVIRMSEKEGLKVLEEPRSVIKNGY